MKRAFPFSDDDRGFTLIEVLIVIIVLGILAAIVVFAVGSTRADAVRSACATRVRAIVGSAEAVKVATQAYPTGPIDRTTAANPLVAPVKGALLKEWPRDDRYFLRYESTDGFSYSIDVYEGDSDSTLVGECRDL